jgi:dienelactone hydrolase
MPKQLPIRLDHLQGNLVLPGHPRGVVILVQRQSINEDVAVALTQANFAVLLMGWMRPDEMLKETNQIPDAERMAERLVSAIDWIENDGDTRRLQTGLFGTNTGAAAVMMAAARRPKKVKAVATIGGDLSGVQHLDLEMPILTLEEEPDSSMLTEWFQKHLMAPHEPVY